MISGISIIVSPDGLKAYLQIGNGNSDLPVRSVIDGLLKGKGVVFGIDQKALNEICSGKVMQEQYEIARGIPPRAGVPGHIKILIDLSKVGKPHELENGRVDYRDLGNQINVRKGTQIARKIPPQPGHNGKSVFGRVINPPQMSDNQLTLRPGTCFSKTDPNLILAAIDGALFIHDDGTVEIQDSKVIENDIDFSTGNIKFAGNLVIKGNVRAGFSVESYGDLSIEGNVEDAQIKGGGNIVVEGGAVGSGTGCIECKGSLKIRHIENFKIKACGDVSILEDTLHSSIQSEGRVRAKSIIGGTVSGFVIESEVIGSTAEPKTIMDIGIIHKLLAERLDLRVKYAEMIEKLNTLKLQIFQIVRDRMDYNGKLAPDDETSLETIKHDVIDSSKVCSLVKDRIHVIDEIEKKYSSDLGIKAGCIYPNTLIRFGNGERLIMEMVNNIKILSSK